MRHNKIEEAMSIPVGDFWSVLKGNGYDFFSGVPCSILKDILEHALKDPDIRYIPAVRENVALGIASGAYLAGRHSGILIQNSGLGNIVNALTSFNLIYRIPVLIFITWRGFNGHDAPEHMIMGRSTKVLLEDLRIPYAVLNRSYEKQIKWAVKTMDDKSVPVAMILKNGQVA